MNADPHIHTLQIRGNSGYPYYGSFNEYNITYGDQIIIGKLPMRWPWQSEASYQRSCEQKLKRESKKIIARHDSASQKAGEQARVLTTLTNIVRQLQPQEAKNWPSQRNL